VSLIEQVYSDFLYLSTIDTDLRTQVRTGLAKKGGSLHNE
jgi:hypothetical protein